MPFSIEMLAIASIVLLSAGVIAVRRPVVLLWLHIAGRLLLDSRPDITYVNVLWNLSLMEIYTAAFLLLFGVWLLCAGQLKILIAEKALLALIGVHIGSSLVALDPNGFMEVGFKWMYLWMMTAFAVYALRKTSTTTFYWALLLALLYPLINQAVMGFIRGPKCFGPCSYIGTYSHESELASVFLMAIYVPMVLIGLRPLAPMTKWVLISFVVWAHIGLWFNGYRTALVGVLAFWGVMVLPMLRRRVAEGAIAILIGATIAAGIVYVIGFERIVEEYQDIFVFLSNPFHFLEFDVNGGPDDAAELFSGRITLYNILMGHYVQAPFENILIGLGPGASNKIVGTFAHNEFVSALVETGLIGLILLSVYLVSLAKRCLDSMKSGGPVAYMGTAMLFGVIVTALATMPFHDVRSIILMSLIISVTRVAGESKATETHGSAAPVRWPNLVR